MGNVSTMVALEAAACYDVSRFARIVDIGGSPGVLLAALLAAAHATGVLFDRPEVIIEARPVISAQGLAEGVELVGGDFFTEVPPCGDLYVLKSVLHDWDTNWNRSSHLHPALMGACSKHAGADHRIRALRLGPL
jgi:O-methyltransferase domain